MVLELAICAYFFASPCLRGEEVRTYHKLLYQDSSLTVQKMVQEIDHVRVFVEL